MQRCKLGQECIRQTEHQRWSSHPESKLYALVRASAEAMGFQSVIRNLGQSRSTVVCGPAMGVIQRPGLVRTRLVYCKRLFVQGLKRVEGCAICDSVGERPSWGNPNQCLNVELMTKHVSAVNGRYSAGGPTFCPAVLWSTGFRAKQLWDAELSCALLYVEVQSST